MRCRKLPCFTAISSLVLVTCLFFGAVSAVTVPQSTEQLVGNSSDVIRGNVLGVRSQWDDEHTMIYTTVTIEVTEIVMGSIEKGREISVYVPGGLVRDTGMMVEHAAKFEQGEEVIVFLTQLTKMYGVTSWEMGKFTVQNGTVREKNLPVTEYINEIKAVKK